MASYTKNVEALKPYEVQAILDWFMFWLPMDKRGEMMAQFPQIYNKLCGDEICKVVRASDGSPVTQVKTTILKFVDMRDPRAANGDE